MKETMLQNYQNPMNSTDTNQGSLNEQTSVATLQKYRSGKVQEVSTLQLPSTEYISVVTLGTSQGFLTRVINSGFLKDYHHKTVLAPRVISLTGVASNTPSYGSAEAMSLRKSGQTNIVITDLKALGNTKQGYIADLTPYSVLMQDKVWGRDAAARHEIALNTFRAQFPSPLKTTQQLFIIELSDGETEVAQRFQSIQKLGTPADHVLYELVKGRLAGIAKQNPELVFVVTPDLRYIVRIDIRDKNTDTPQEVVNVLKRLYTAGQSGKSEPTPIEADSFDVDQLISKMDLPADGSAPTGPTRAEINAAERIAARKAELYAKQQKVVFPSSRNIANQRTVEEMLNSPIAAKIKTKRATGEFIDKRVSEPRFDAITSSYMDTGTFDQHMVQVIASLSNDPQVPQYIEKFERADASDDLNLKEVLSVVFRDANNKTSTVHIDVPIVTRDGYLKLNGNKYNISKQIMAKPIIKVRPNEVLITTAYNKATIERFGQNASAESSYVRVLAGQLSKTKAKNVTVDLGVATTANAKYRSSVEYDDIARSVRAIRTVDTAFIFSRPALDEELRARSSWYKSEDWVKDGRHPVGYSRSGNRVIFMERDGALSVLNRGESALTKGDGGEITLSRLVYASVKAADPEVAVSAPTVLKRKYMYSRAKMLSQYLPTAVIVGYSIGLTGMLSRIGVEHRIVDREAYRRSDSTGYDVIEFKDGYLVYKPERIRDSILLNGLKELSTEDASMTDYAAGGIGWVDYIADRLGSPGHAKALVNYQTSFIDPMTKDLLHRAALPTDMAGVIIHASNMLENNTHSDPNDMASYRMRGPELINTMLYKILHREMERVRATRQSASPQRLMVNQAELIRMVQGASNVEEVSELNPLLEAELRGKATWTGAAGGLGDGRTVNRAMRAYHPSMQGIYGFYSPDSAEIGVKRTLSFGTSVTDVYGQFDLDVPKDHASQNLALGELITPFVATHADPPRIAMQSKQATHTMPIKKHTPMLVGSGAEKSLAHAIGNTYAYKSRINGTITAIDEKNQLVTLKYDDGETAYIDMSPRSVKNSGGGFYITAQLQLKPGMKVGSKFDADKVLAYDPTYFYADTSDGSTSYMAGVLTRCALVALDQTYEDSLMVTRDLVDNTVALATMSRSINLGAKANLQSHLKVGEVVNPNSSLVVFENVTDDADISTLLQRVGAEFDDAIAELTQNTASAKYAGKIVEIRIHYNRDIGDLSPSLQKFVNHYIKAAEARKSAAKGAPIDEPVRTNTPIRVNRDKVGGEVLDGVLITYLIQVEDVAAPGDKYVCTSPLKGVISRVLERGEEPFDEEDRQIDYIMSPLSVVSRMTSDFFLSAWSNSILYDLKTRVLEEFDA